MSILRQVAQRARHLPGLGQESWFWPLLRQPYRWALDPLGRGMPVRLGGSAHVRIPVEHSGIDWEEFEPDAVAHFHRWVSEHPNGLVLDIGCSLGIFSAVALFASPKVEVVAFDPNLASLVVTRQMTQYASGHRLSLVHGFVARQSTKDFTLGAAITATQVAIQESGSRGDPNDMRYQNLFDADAPSVPAYRLDDLLSDMRTNDRPLLIKCDVEGAELEVLMGASDVLRRLKPDLLLSVHDQGDYGLPRYGQTKADVEAFLRDHDYEVNCFAVDHEEHWACRYRAPAAA